MEQVLTRWLPIGLAVLAVYLASWVLMVVLARRLPAGLLRYAARSIPRPVLLAAWPADPRLLIRVLEGRRAVPPAGCAGQSG